MAPLSRENSAADKVMDTSSSDINVEEVSSAEPMTSAPAPAPVVAGPPPLEIVFSFDTTGSMNNCIEAVSCKHQSKTKS